MGVPVREVFAGDKRWCSTRHVVAQGGGGVCKANEQMTITANSCVNKHNCVFA